MPEPRPSASTSVSMVGVVLYLSSTAYSWMRMIQVGVRGFVPASVLMAIPTTATVLFLVACLICPSLVAIPKMRFPLNITLPVVFGAMMKVSLVLWTESHTPLFQLTEALQPARFWKDSTEIFKLGLLQVILFTLLAGLVRNRATSSDRTTPTSPVPPAP